MNWLPFLSVDGRLYASSEDWYLHSTLDSKYAICMSAYTGRINCR